MSVDINSIINNVYKDFTANFLAAIGTDSKELLVTGATYVTDAKVSLTAIGAAALATENPMSWSEFKLKMIEEGKIGVAAFKSVEQLFASDLQAFFSSQIAFFESLLLGELVKLQQPQ